jgi:hypothetical protein
MMYVPTDHPALQVMFKPLFSQLLLESMESDETCDLNDDINVFGRAELGRSRIGDPELNRGSSNENDSAKEAAELLCGCLQ